MDKEEKNSYLSEKVMFEGDITINRGELKNNGNIKGNITGGSFSQKENGSMRGNLKVKQFINEGQIDATIEAERVELKNKSKTKAKIFSKEIVIETGSHFDVIAQSEDNKKL